MVNTSVGSFAVAALLRGADLEHTSNYSGLRDRDGLAKFSAAAGDANLA